MEATTDDTTMAYGQMLGIRYGARSVQGYLWHQAMQTSMQISVAMESEDYS